MGGEEGGCRGRSSMTAELQRDPTVPAAKGWAATGANAKRKRNNTWIGIREDGVCAVAVVGGRRSSGRQGR